MGYCNSTPTNVMIAESKVEKIEDRVGLLARNCWTKLVNRSDRRTIARM